MEAELVYEVVKRLIGDTSPKGCASRDKDVFINVNNLCGLTNMMIDRLKEIELNAESYEQSVKDIGERAKQCLDNISNEINYG